MAKKLKISKGSAHTILKLYPYKRKNNPHYFKEKYEIRKREIWLINNNNDMLFQLKKQKELSVMCWVLKRNYYHGLIKN